MIPEEISRKAKVLQKISSLRVIGEKLGMSHATVAYRIKHHNWRVTEALVVEKLYRDYAESIL